MKVLFRMGARIVLVAGCVEKNLGLQQGNWENLEESAKLKYAARAFEQQAMGVGMKVEGRLHATSKKDW